MEKKPQDYIRVGIYRYFKKRALEKGGKLTRLQQNHPFEVWNTFSLQIFEANFNFAVMLKCVELGS